MSRGNGPVNVACRVNSRGMPGEHTWGEIGLRRRASSGGIRNAPCRTEFGRLCCTSGRRKSGRANDAAEGLQVNRRKPLQNHHLAPVLPPFVGFAARRGKSTLHHSNRRKSFLLGRLLATEPARGENVAAKGAWSFRFVSRGGMRPKRPGGGGHTIVGGSQNAGQARPWRIKGTGIGKSRSGD